MSAFEEGDFVVKVISIAGMKTATIQKVAGVKGNCVEIVDSCQAYHAGSGREIDPAIPGRWDFAGKVGS